MKHILLLLSLTLVLIPAGTTAVRAQDDTAKSELPDKDAAAEVNIPTVVPEGVVFDFEGDTTVLHHKWIVVTDTIMQGKSTGTASIVADGAAGSEQSLKIEGTVQSDNPFVMFSGLASRFGGDSLLAYDVSEFTGVHFWARGDGNTYRIELPSAAIKDYMYYSFPFTPPTDEWKEYRIPFKGFKQQPYGKKVPWTGTDIIGVHFFTVGGPLESFELQVDQIEFYK
jgi:hypothetical protein